MRGSHDPLLVGKEQEKAKADLEGELSLLLIRSYHCWGVVILTNVHRVKIVYRRIPPCRRIL
jgi:hypothetical protein